MGGVEAPLQVSVLYNRCCACFKCWLQVAKLRLYSYYCAKLGQLACFHNQPNLGLSWYLKGLVLTSQTLDLEAETLRDICERRNLIESDMIFVQFYVYSI